MKDPKPKLFIQLSTGTITTDNSMGRNTRRFSKDDFKLLVRPHLIESIQGKAIREYNQEPINYSVVLISGLDRVVLSLNSPAEIMEMIEAIECAETEEIPNANT